ncbi:MAG: thiazole synthase [Beijerinckiaceae bacterium]|nr:thiazole synthase [Beijerinckiaceae bacterium]
MLTLLGEPLASRLFLGTARFPSLDLLSKTLITARPGMITVAVRRPTPGPVPARGFMDMLEVLATPLLPNTAGCHTVHEAVTTARLAREMFGTSRIKLEVIGSRRWLEPDGVGLVEAAEILVKEGFEVFPYMTEDLAIAERLLRAGCRVLMPWAAPIGSGRGLENRTGLLRLREAFPAVPMILDAGLGRPSHAAEAMELGFDAVLLNTAVAESGDPLRMALAFASAVEAGRLAFEAGLVATRHAARASTPDEGKAAFA